MTGPRPSTIVCDVGALAPDAPAVDVLARLQLEAKRLGHEIRLRNASNELRELLIFAGLRDVLRVEPSCVEPSYVKPGGQTEEREQPLRVEEEGELDDPAA
jgi:hypothetical protein